MATYSRAKEVRDAAFQLISDLGATVLQARIRQRGAGWGIEVETAAPFQVTGDQPLAINGVQITLVDRGIVPRRLRRAAQIAKLAGAQR